VVDELTLAFAKDLVDKASYEKHKKFIKSVSEI